MGLLDKIGIKKKSTGATPPAAKKEKTAEPEKTESVAPKPAKSDTGRAYQILLRPLLSEKGTHLAGKGEYVFAVHPKANKTEIRKSIQKVYDVKVEKVRIVNLPGKRRRYGRTIGRTAASKKAIVKVAAGQKIPGIIESVG
ncbi:MAG: 50S ribosomal protein L23 [Parcubacteria group bacterium GW2011_GWA2_52_8]|nr:MAG: 50S ribosomal protein L23 [Parcubacteria group bacterium GW2011_GWA2_52_8]